MEHSAQNTEHWTLLMNDTENCSCEEPTVETLSRLVLRDFLLPLVSGMGIMGNLVAIIVLRCPEMKSTFHQSLLMLAICDMLFLGLTLHEHFVDVNWSVYIILNPHIWNPLKNILMSWETFLIMSISTERFLAICKPLCYGSHKLSHSSRVHLLTYILPSIVSATVLNIPKFFEITVVFANRTDETNNLTTIVAENVVTDLRLDEDYIFYYMHVTKLLVTGLAPAAFLAGINIAICVKLHEKKIPPYRAHDKQTCSEDLTSGNLSQKHVGKKPKNSALTLGTIVILYLVCNTPRLSLNMAEYVLGDTLYQVDYCNCSMAPTWIFILIWTSHLFLVINSSSNFLIYFSVCKRFKRIFGIKFKIFVRHVKCW